MLFMSFLTVAVVKNSHILPGIYFIFVKEHPRPNWKVLQCQIWTSVKRSKKKLSSNTNFSTFLQLCGSNFRLQLFKDLRVTKIVKQIKFEGTWGKLEAKTVSRDNHREII